MNSNENRIKQIEVENFVWIVYIFLIGLCLYANSFEKSYFEKGNIKDKETYRSLTIIIFVIAVIVYIYFFIDGYDSIKNINKYTNKKTKDLNNLSFIGTSLVLISGLIFLYIAVVDTNLDVEIAFN